jgi:hypothetical protein
MTESIDFFVVQALYVKAESLYHTCRFERALVIFLRARRLAPDFEGLTESPVAICTYRLDRHTFTLVINCL